MSISTLDGVIAGALPPQDLYKVGTALEAIGLRHSHFYSTGMPGAASAPANGMAGAALTSVVGQIPFTNPTGGNYTYLARFEAAISVACELFLMDRLWDNSGIVVTTTGAQTINSVAWPARDRDGTTNGENVLVAIEVRTATTNASAITNTTMSYTNQSGTSGKTATISSFPATAVAGTFVPFQLAAGDRGIRSIQTITLGTSYVSGAIHLVAYKVIAVLPSPIPNVGQSVDALSCCFPRLYNDTVPFLVQLGSATTATNISGRVVYTQG